MVALRRSKSLLRSAWGALALAVALAPACTPPTAPPDDGALTAPFAVSDHFSPTGYMGDGTTIGVVNMVAAACTSRAPDAVGDCYQVTYTPPYPAADGWAGVYWQYPGNNWGGYPGHTILPGATKATVWAMGAHGGEQLQFRVGGIAVADDTQPYHDSIQVPVPPVTVTLTTQWQQFTVDFGGATYDQVLGGFAWLLNLPTLDGGAPDTQPIVFYLDAIRWSP
jgi:hypothetical protein